MNLIKFSYRLLLIGLAIAWAVCNVGVYLPNAYADTQFPLRTYSTFNFQVRDDSSIFMLMPNIKIAQIEELCRFFGFCQDRKKEDRRADQSDEGGRNGRCSNLGESLKAFIPVFQSSGISTNNIINSIGSTVSDSPTFWFYLPSLNTQNRSPVEIAEFAMQDEKGKRDIFDPPIQLRLPSKSGIVSFTLPSEYAKKLQVNQPYHWYFSIICDSRRPSRNLSVNGWIQREDNAKKIDLNHGLVAAETDGKRVETYANHDLWYDTVTTLLKFRCNNPNDIVLEKYWLSLLEEVGLGQKSTTLLCSPKEQIKVAIGSNLENHF